MMTYDVILENGNQSYQATVLSWPSCSAEGATREEALRRLRVLLRERLSEVEIVRMEMGDQEPDPMLRFAGVFKDDPLFDEAEEEIKVYRREIDADEGVKGAQAMRGFARRFRATRTTDEWMAELREGES